MPTLFRFVTVIAMIAGLCAAAMVALAVLVSPRQVEMRVPVQVENAANPVAQP